MTRDLSLQFASCNHLLTMSNSNNSSGGNPLLSKKSLALALSAPRAPPYGSIHRQVYLGKAHHNSSDTAWSRHYRITDDRHERDASSNRSHPINKNHEEAHSFVPHDTLRQRLRQRILTTKHPDAPAHPHLQPFPEWGDRVTRSLGLLLPLKWQNSCRDSGGFRSICDTLVTATAPSAALTKPAVALQFIRNTLAMERIHYGSHNRQFIHLYRPRSSQSSEPIDPTRLLFFVHGGAWGSGEPWFYRLVANPRFLKEYWAVAVIGMRTYPDGCVAEQVEDCLSALDKVHEVLANPQLPTTVMGHSSGAHLSMLLIIDHVIAQLSQQTPSTPALATVDSYVGLSGPYDISHHFDYEAARGVEELSPMKPVNGYTRHNFQINSPAQRLQSALAHIYQASSTEKPDNQSLISTAALDHLIPPMCLVHGMDDATVPFTSTAEAARVLKSCGVTHVDEIYLADVGHQDVVMHFMMGGSALDETFAWIHKRHKEELGSSSRTHMRIASRL